MAIFDKALLTEVLGSIEANRLAILCGAGLSIPSPSNLPPAAWVAEICYEKWRPIEVLPAAMKSDVDQLAGHFHAGGHFVDRFISTLVPWNELVGEPNEGHAAIADFLVARAASATLSANFDPLIEQWAERHKIAMRGALTGAEAISFAGTSNPLLKFHGCITRGRNETLWTQGQLTEPDVQARISDIRNWLQLHLPGKDLVVVGFWTDWGYLNDAFADVISTMKFGTVIVVDPSESAQLQTKAPNLWSQLQTGSSQFHHVKASGADALREIREQFSNVFAKKFFELGKPLLKAEGKAYPAAIDSHMFDCSHAYDLRRDVEGEPYNRAARMRAPGLDSSQAAHAHLLLLSAGASIEGAWYRLKGRTVRVVQGAGKALSTVRDYYREPPAMPSADVVICAGAVDFKVPASIISSGRGASVVRPSGGSTSEWLTLDQARAELSI